MLTILKCIVPEHQNRPLHYIAECPNNKNKLGMHLLCEKCVSLSIGHCCSETSIRQEDLEKFQQILPLFHLINSWTDAPQDPLIVLQKYIDREREDPMKRKLIFLKSLFEKVEISGKYWFIKLSAIGIAIFKNGNNNFDGVGEGIEGQVYWGGFLRKYKNNGDFPDKKFAIKSISTNKCFQQRVWKAETDRLKNFFHPNVALYLDAHRDPTNGNCYLIMQYCSGNTLRNLIEAFDIRNHRNGKLCLPEPVVCWVAMQISQGLFALHQRGLSHQDLKPENIVVQGNINSNTIRGNYLNLLFKITDFGHALNVDQTKMENATVFPCMECLCLTNPSLRSGTKAYCAPEQIICAHNSNDGTKLDMQKYDIWSSGVLFYECIVGDVPEQKRELTADDQNLFREMGYSNSAFNFIECMIRHDASKRMDTNQLIEHEFVRPHLFQVELLYGELCLIRLFCQLGVKSFSGQQFYDPKDEEFSLGEFLKKCGLHKISTNPTTMAKLLKTIAQLSAMIAFATNMDFSGFNAPTNLLGTIGQSLGQNLGIFQINKEMTPLAGSSTDDSGSLPFKKILEINKELSPLLNDLLVPFSENSFARDKAWINGLAQSKEFKKCIQCLASGNKELQLFELLRNFKSECTNYESANEDIIHFLYEGMIPPPIPSLIYGRLLDFQFIDVYKKIMLTGAADCNCKLFVARHNRNWGQMEAEDELKKKYFDEIIEHVQTCTMEAAHKIVPVIAIHFNSAIEPPKCCPRHEFQPHPIQGYSLVKEIVNAESGIAFELILMTTRKCAGMEYFWLRRKDFNIQEQLPALNSIACLNPIDFFMLAWLARTIPHIDGEEAKQLLDKQPIVGQIMRILEVMLAENPINQIFNLIDSFF